MYLGRSSAAQRGSLASPQAVPRASTTRHLPRRYLPTSQLGGTCKTAPVGSSSTTRRRAGAGTKNELRGRPDGDGGWRAGRWQREPSLRPTKHQLRLQLHLPRLRSGTDAAAMQQRCAGTDSVGKPLPPPDWPRRPASSYADATGAHVSAPCSLGRAPRSALGPVQGLRASLGNSPTCFFYFGSRCCMCTMHLLRAGMLHTCLVGT